MVRVEMADKDMVDFFMMNPNSGELLQGSWPHIKEHETLI